MAATLRSPFYPSISPLNSHSSPAAPATVNFSSKSTVSKGSFVVTRKRDISATALNSQYSPTITENLGDVSIFTAAGDPVVFKDLWDQDQVYFSDNYIGGDEPHNCMNRVCPYHVLGNSCGGTLEALWMPMLVCWELASSLKESKPRFDSAGVKLIAVGVGAPNKARILAERLPFPMDCLYADPDRKAYSILNLYYGFGRTFFNPASAKVFSRFDALQKAVKNYTIEATPDDRSGVLQQGGMFVFRGKQLLYARKDEGTGDHAPLDDVFDVCCKAPVA